MLFLNLLPKAEITLDYPKKINVIALDIFGDAVLKHLKLVLDNGASRITRVVDVPTVKCDAENTYIIISGKPVTAYCLEIEERCHTSGAKLLPVTIETSILQVGPLVIPGRTPCWECCDQRLTSQHAFPQERTLLAEFYAREPQHHSLGFMPYTAMIAAHRIAHELESLNKNGEADCGIWRMNIYTRDVSIAGYIGRHGCKKCGSREPESDRSLRNLRQYLCADDSVAKQR